MKPQAILTGLAAAAFVAALLAITSGILLALAVALPIGILIAAIFGRVSMSIERKTIEDHRDKGPQ